MRMVKLSEQERVEAVGSLRRYVEENTGEALGELAAGLMVDFFVEEVGPVIYNRAIGDAQARMQSRVADLSGELFEDAFQYWPRVEVKRKKRR